ncbi:MAG: hypothetical protein GY927_09195 [bacterium]|nr:hypothetical protein [bacterium]
MRITQNRPVSGPRKPSKSTPSSSAEGGFSLGSQTSASQTAPSTQVSTSSPIGGISALLAVQGDDHERQRSAAVSCGHDTLDILDSLKIDVLSGQVSRQKLVHLAALVKKPRDNFGDPTLMNVLDHIELRARVELAKMEQNRR